ARLTVFQQVAEPAVGVLGGAQACVLAHRPQTAAVHRGVRAARERERPGVAEAVAGVPSVEVSWLVEGPELDARVRDAALVAHRITPRGGTRAARDPPARMRGRRRRGRERGAGG